MNIVKTIKIKFIDFVFDNISEKIGCKICIFFGHPAGVFYFNVCGLEPDMTCKSCGEDLG